MERDATALLEQARAAWDAEQWGVAAARYEQLLALKPDAPESPAWWYDAALAYKFLRNWSKAFELGRHAAEQAAPGEGDPAFWNLGIAATILGEWAVARQAWADYGVPLPPGDGEINGDFGTACVRLIDDTPEVVWVQRICPTRARVTSVPFGDRRFGEIVVHDGAPNGERVVDGCRYPVFDELLLSEASATPTFQATVTCGAATDVAALGSLAETAGLAVERVSGMVMHRRAESEGRVELAQNAAEAGEHDILIAAPGQEAARAVLEQWTAESAGRAWRGLREKQGNLLSPAPAPVHGRDGAHPVERQLEWPFDDGTFPANLGVIAHRSLLTGAEPPRHVVHDQDGGWQALDGVSPTEAEYAVVACMMCLVELHPELAALADLPPGWRADRDEPDTPWHRSEHTDDDE